MDGQKSHDIVAKDELILVTGATGFIGCRVVEVLLNKGFRNLRCLARSPKSSARLQQMSNDFQGKARVDVWCGNLLSREDCIEVSEDAVVILHLAAGRGEKSYPEAYLNSVVTTRNLMEASISHGCLRRFVNVSSFAVYSNTNKPRKQLLDESCPIEAQSELRGDAYAFAKVKQDEIVIEYGNKFKLPYVIVRPGHVYGPGNEAISARVGISTFGTFLHLGGSNKIPLTYVDNCAEAIVLAGVTTGVECETFNVVDDDLPSSRHFLRLYKKSVAGFRSIYLPHFVSYCLCLLWERYSIWSEGQLPPVFNVKKWHALWGKTQYSNGKLKKQLGWTPRVSTREGLSRYFKACREREANA